MISEPSLDRESLDAAAAELEARFPGRCVWWVHEVSFPGKRALVSWHSKRVGAAVADVHADSAADLEKLLTQRLEENS